jgi:glycosyltransferase involved in cell wall biosynthesis
MQQKKLEKELYLALIERKLVKSAAAIHCTSYLEQEQLMTLGLRPRSIVIPNPVRTEWFEKLPMRGALREVLGIPPTATVSLFVGRLHKMKRIDLVISAFAKMARKCREAYFLVVGPDEDGSGRKAKDQVQEMGLQSVFFPRYTDREGLIADYADADLLVLFSHRENFGMVVIEAMAAGLPLVVGTDVEVAEDVRRSGVGYAVSQNGSNK